MPEGPPFCEWTIEVHDARKSEAVRYTYQTLGSTTKLYIAVLLFLLLFLPPSPRASGDPSFSVIGR